MQKKRFNFDIYYRLNFLTVDIKLNLIMNKLLILKHWQLWIVVFIIPMMIADFFDLFKETTILLFRNTTAIKVFALITQFTATGFLLYWIWVLGTNLYLKVTDKLNLKIKWFKVAFFTILISYLLIGLIRFLSFRYLDYGFILLMIVFSLVLLIGYCYLYCIHVLTKLINAIESCDLDTPTNQYNKDYILLLIYPIGIWFMQPRINLIFKDK